MPPSTDPQHYRTMPSPHSPASGHSSAPQKACQACCTLLLRLFTSCFGKEQERIPDSPRSQALEPTSLTHSAHYQPCHSAVESSQAQQQSSVPIYRTDPDAERAGLLPKTSEPSAPFERLQRQSSKQSRHASGSGTSSQQQQQAPASHRRTRSHAEASRLHKSKVSGGSATEVLGASAPLTLASMAHVASAYAGTNVLPAASTAEGMFSKLPPVILLDSQLEDEQEDVCATCLEQYTVQNPKTFTECGHHFHLQCIFEWLNHKETCPICETPMHIPGLL